MANFNKCMAEEFDSTKVYSINDMVTYNNMLYKCTKQDYTAQEFSTDNFELTYLTDVLGMGNVIDDNIAPLYDNTLTYTVGDYVMYNRYLYVCNTNIETGEDFDSTKWDQCYITDLFESDVNSNLDKYVRGSIEYSSSAHTKVTLGFKPSFILMWTSPKYAINIYDESYSTTKQIGAGTQTVEYEVNIPYTPNAFYSIDDDGFTVSKCNAKGYMMHYIALK